MGGGGHDGGGIAAGMLLSGRNVLVRASESGTNGHGGQHVHLDRGHIGTCKGRWYGMMVACSSIPLFASDFHVGMCGSPWAFGFSGEWHPAAAFS